MIFIRIKGHFDDKIFLTKFKDISQNSRTFHGFQGFQGHCGNLVKVKGLKMDCKFSVIFFTVDLPKLGTHRCKLLV